MGWSAYEVFSVISGVILIAWAVFDDGGEDEELTPALRLGGAVTGAVFIGYGFWVANQPGGIFVFPVIIFALPIVALYRIGKRLLEGPSSPGPGSTTTSFTARPAHGSIPVPSDVDHDPQPPTDEAPAPGWYADPGGSERLRRWDGDRWSDETRLRP